MKEQISYSRYHTRLHSAPCSLILQFKAVLLCLGGVNHFSEVIFTAFTIVISKHTNMHAHTRAFSSTRGSERRPKRFYRCFSRTLDVHGGVGGLWRGNGNTERTLCEPEIMRARTAPECT